MFTSSLETPQDDDSAVQTSTFRFRHPKTKKYMLHKMVTQQEKQAMNNLRRKEKKKDPEYFSKMLKQQKKKMFVNTFIKKLKNSIILTKPPPECKSSSEQIQEQQQESIEISKNVEVGIAIFLFLQLVPLMVANSLSLIFQQVLESDFLQGYNIFGCIVHMFQMCMRLFIRHDSEEKKKKFLKQNINSYIYSQDLIIDSLVLISFFISMTVNSTENNMLVYICHLIILLKIKTLLNMLSLIQLVLIENQYREQIWNLIKVFLFNFVIAHCLAITLISMGTINQEKNWIKNKGLDDALWFHQYIWGYYWAVTIMLTVGFGDITPTNHQEALCMIFIETMSCIVLAYNINRVGSIIAKIRSYDLQKNSNLKVFKQISQKSQIDNEIEDKITNYIKESTIIKRNSNIEEEKNFISKLPQSFKEELLKEMNKNIWNGMIFFRNLSEKSLLELSKHLQKKLTHPQQVVYTRGHVVDVMIFNHGTFGLAYNNGTARSNGKIIQKYFVNKNQFRVASLEFLLDNPLNYDIKCIDYMIFYKIKLKSFLAILENYPYDYEYYFMIKEKDKFLLNEFQIQKCHICQNERHTMYKCPRLHYIPLKQHVIGRYCKGMKKKHLQNLRSKIMKRQKLSDISSLKAMKNIKNEMIKIRLQLNAFESESEITYMEKTYQKFSQPQIHHDQNQNLSIEDKFRFSNMQQKTIFDFAFDQMKQGLEFKHKQYHNQTRNGVWELECDLAHNFKFYFKQFNAEDLDFKALKKKYKNSQTI